MNLYLLLVLLLLSCESQPVIADKAQASKLFKSWNEETRKSLNDTAAGDLDQFTKALYDNRRLISEKASLVDSFSGNHSRYKFVELLLEKGFSNEHLLIIEDNRSGSSVRIKNTILFLSGKRELKILIYYYVDGIWNLVTKSDIPAVGFPDSMTHLIVSFGKGINEDDLIVTEFDSAAVKSSAYFAVGTASPLTKLQDIIQIE